MAAPALALAYDAGVVIYNAVPAIPSLARLYGYVRTSKVLSAVGYTAIAGAGTAGVIALDGSSRNSNIDKFLGSVRDNQFSLPASRTDKLKRDISGALETPVAKRTRSQDPNITAPRAVTQRRRGPISSGGASWLQWRIARTSATARGANSTALRKRRRRSVRTR